MPEGQEVSHFRKVSARVDQYPAGSVGAQIDGNLVQISAALATAKADTDPRARKRELALTRLQTFYGDLRLELDAEDKLATPDSALTVAAGILAKAIEREEVLPAEALLKTAQLANGFGDLRDFVAKTPRMRPVGWEASQRAEVGVKPVEYPPGSVGELLQRALDSVTHGLAEEGNPTGELISERALRLRRLDTFYRALGNLLETQKLTLVDHPTVVNTIGAMARAVDRGELSITDALVRIPPLVMHYSRIGQRGGGHPLFRTVGHEEEIDPPNPPDKQ
ncbi:MAG: hypothetical protein AAB538_03200 [Patescibacteria group bacterium]